MHRFQLQPALLAAALLVGALLLSGCTKPAGPIFQPPSSALAWPPPPDAPRIFWIGQFAGSADLKPPQRFGQQLSTALFGKEPQHIFIAPMGVCTDGGDRVFVADGNAQLIHVLNLATRTYEQWRPPANQPRLMQPIALAWAPRAGAAGGAAGGAGRLLVADSVGRAVVVFSASGEFQGQLGTPGMFVRPCGIAIDHPNQRILVADPGSHQIVALTLDGNLIKRIGERGTDPGSFNFPTYIAVAPDGRIYVSDSLNFRVQVFTPDFTPLRSIGSKGDMPGYFSQPKGIAVSPAGHLYIVDSNFEAIQVFSADGDLLMTFGREGRGPGEFWLPSSIFFDQSSRIWVADNYNKRIQVFQYRPQEASP
jgi:DNA-binding beta-propeller fold protein YncE